MDLKAYSFTTISLLLSVVFAALISTVLIPSKMSRTSKYLLFALIGCHLYAQVIIEVIVRSPNIYSDSFWLRSAYPFELSSPPLAYLYVLSVIRRDFDWKSIPWIHGLPFVFGLIAIGIGSALSIDFAVDRYLRTWVSLVVTITYIWSARQIIITLQNELKTFCSSFAGLHLPWLKFLLLVSYCAIILKLLDLVTGPQIPLWIYRGVITNLGLIGLTYFGLRASSLFNYQKSSETTSSEPAKPHHVVTINSPEEAEHLKAKLLKCLVDQEFYLKPQIRLADIANEMSIKSYKLSEVINRGLQTNFYDLINGLRVEHAKKLMGDPTKSHLNLLGIALDSGFNSKSVFNDYFRRKTGLTPSEYRTRQGIKTEPNEVDDRIN